MIFTRTAEVKGDHLFILDINCIFDLFSLDFANYLDKLVGVAVFYTSSPTSFNEDSP